jgi:hypothetical protein
VVELYWYKVVELYWYKVVELYWYKVVELYWYKVVELYGYKVVELCCKVAVGHNPARTASLVEETAKRNMAPGWRSSTSKVGGAPASGSRSDHRKGTSKRNSVPCPGRKPPFLAVKRPARPYKTRHTKLIYIGKR